MYRPDTLIENIIVRPIDNKNKWLLAASIKNTTTGEALQTCENSSCANAAHWPSTITTTSRQNRREPGSWEGGREEGRKMRHRTWEGERPREILKESEAFKARKNKITRDHRQKATNVLLTSIPCWLWYQHVHKLTHTHKPKRQCLGLSRLGL